MSQFTCYLQEEDPPEDHDIGHYSCVCGRCYGALADLERDARQQVTMLTEHLQRAIAAIHTGTQDMSEWLQLARRQHDEMPHNAPLCPSQAGIESSELRRKNMAQVVLSCRRAIGG